MYTLSFFPGTSAVRRVFQRRSNNRRRLCVGQMDCDELRNSGDLFDPRGRKRTNTGIVEIVDDETKSITPLQQRSVKHSSSYPFVEFVQDRSQCITTLFVLVKVVKFSPDGQLLALGSRDNYIYVYQVTDGAKHYTRLGRCTVSSSSCTHVFLPNRSTSVQ